MGDYPSKKPKKALPTKSVYMLCIQNKQDELLLEKRPNKGIWGGLWSLPEVPIDANIKEACFNKFHCAMTFKRQLNPLRHTFSHYHLTITPILVSTRASKKVMEKGDFLWYKPEYEQTAGLPAPIKKIVGQLYAQNGQLQQAQ